MARSDGAFFSSASPGRIRCRRHNYGAAGQKTKPNVVILKHCINVCHSELALLVLSRAKEVSKGPNEESRSLKTSFSKSRFFTSFRMTILVRSAPHSVHRLTLHSHLLLSVSAKE